MLMLSPNIGPPAPRFLELVFAKSDLGLVLVANVVRDLVVKKAINHVLTFRLAYFGKHSAWLCKGS